MSRRLHGDSSFQNENNLVNLRSFKSAIVRISEGRPDYRTTFKDVSIKGVEKCWRAGKSEEECRIKADILKARLIISTKFLIEDYTQDLKGDQ